MSSDFSEKALICITTCLRSISLRSGVWEYIDFCQRTEGFEFIVSLDGEDPETIGFCNKYNIPLLYSREREGVGISKNRVLERYDDYDHYFFIEDDVELIDDAVFAIYIDVAKASGIPHLSLFRRDRLRGKAGCTNVNGFTIEHAMFGSAQFNYFDGDKVRQVGGFHPYFAKLRRYGHTEHSYRFVNAGMAEYPFNVVCECYEGYLKWLEPMSVTKPSVKTTENRLYEGEEALMQRKLSYYPVTTLSTYVAPKDLSLCYVSTQHKKIIYVVAYRGALGVIGLARLVKRMVRGAFRATKCKWHSSE